MKQCLYIIGDGDRIRTQIERLLLDNRLSELSLLSRSIVDAVEAIRTRAVELLSAEVVMAGGDDVLICVPRDKYDIELVKKLAASFQELCDCSISFGVGDSAETAFIALRKAKAKGGGVICEHRTER